MSAPTVKTELVYTGEAQDLINAGSATGGVLFYALTTENTAPADNLYTTSIPTGTDAGTYYVWYKFIGDEGYADTDPVCLPVTISEGSIEVASSGDVETVVTVDATAKPSLRSQVAAIVAQKSITITLSDSDDVNINLLSNNADETSEKVINDIAKVESEKVSGQKIGAVLDLILKFTITDSDGEEKDSGNISESTTEISVTVPIPEELLEVSEGITRNFQVARVHNGVVTILPTVREGNRVRFSSKLFSTYVILYDDEEVTDTSGNTISTEESESTPSIIVDLTYVHNPARVCMSPGS